MGRHSINGPDDPDDPRGRPTGGVGRPSDDGYVGSDYYSDEGFDDIDAFDGGDGNDQEDDDGYRYDDEPTTGRGRSLSRHSRAQIRVGDRGFGQWRGGHRSESGRRGVSVGVVAALVTVIVVVGAVILWRFFGASLAHRSATAARHCPNGDLAVAVVADPSIADHLQGFADTFNKSANPVGDRCVSVRVKPADSDAVIDGFIGEWPAQLGDRPALWVPGSSISTARLKASAGEQTISDSRSLVTSPVLLAGQPKLRDAVQKQSWGALPKLQSNVDALAGLRLPGWGSLRLALPVGGNGDASFLAAEAVASAAAPTGAPVVDGISAVRTLLDNQPRLADNSLADAMNILVRPDDPAAAPVHAVVTTEQQVFSRGESQSDVNGTLTSWLPPGPVAVSDYPTALLSGSWLSQDQISAASEFARFAHKPEQLAELAAAGFRVEGVAPPKSDVTGFQPLGQRLSVGDDALRATLADTLGTSSIGSSVSIMLDQSMTTSEGGDTRFGIVTTALNTRIGQLSSKSAVGLWTFDGIEGRSVVAPAPLSDQDGGQSQSATLSNALDNLHSVSGGAVSFTTVPLVYADALANYRPGMSNSVLVITAGPHTDRTLDGAGLQDYVRKNVDPQRPVVINVIDFGGDPDRATWEKVAQLSGGSYQNVAHANSPEFTAALRAFLS